MYMFKMHTLIIRVGEAREVCKTHIKYEISAYHIEISNY